MYELKIIFFSGKIELSDFRFSAYAVSASFACCGFLLGCQLFASLNRVFLIYFGNLEN